MYPPYWVSSKEGTFHICGGLFFRKKGNPHPNLVWMGIPFCCFSMMMVCLVQKCASIGFCDTVRWSISIGL